VRSAGENSFEFFEAAGKENGSKMEIFGKFFGSKILASKRHFGVKDRQKMTPRFDPGKRRRKIFTLTEGGGSG
jgi:hypothetical protein